MALTVFLVDNLTRLVLPDSQWGFNVRERLSQQGHVLTATSQCPSQVEREREAEELQWRDDLLEQTGL